MRTTVYRTRDALHLYLSFCKKNSARVLSCQRVHYKLLVVKLGNHICHHYRQKKRLFCKKNRTLMREYNKRDGGDEEYSSSSSSFQHRHSSMKICSQQIGDKNSESWSSMSSPSSSSSLFIVKLAFVSTSIDFFALENISNFVSSSLQFKVRLDRSCSVVFDSPCPLPE